MIARKQASNWLLALFGVDGIEASRGSIERAGCSSIVRVVAVGKAFASL